MIDWPYQRQAGVNRDFNIKSNQCILNAKVFNVHT